MVKEREPRPGDAIGEPPARALARRIGVTSAPTTPPGAAIGPRAGGPGGGPDCLPDDQHETGDTVVLGRSGSHAGMDGPGPSASVIDRGTNRQAFEDGAVRSVLAPRGIAGETDLGTDGDGARIHTDGIGVPAGERCTSPAEVPGGAGPHPADFKMGLDRVRDRRDPSAPTATGLRGTTLIAIGADGDGGVEMLSDDAPTHRRGRRPSRSPEGAGATGASPPHRARRGRCVRRRGALRPPAPEDRSGGHLGALRQRIVVHLDLQRAADRGTFRLRSKLRNPRKARKQVQTREIQPRFPFCVPAA